MHHIDADPIVKLSEHAGLSLIIEHSSGIRYSNQARGTVNFQPELKGFLVPLRNEVLVPSNELISPENDLLNYFEGPKYGGTGATSGIDEEDADVIDSVLTKYRLDGVLRVDRTKLNSSQEAWVFVELLGDENPGIVNEGSASLALFEGFGPYPVKGVITWSNSD